MMKYIEKDKTTMHYRDGDKQDDGRIKEKNSCEYSERE